MVSSDFGKRRLKKGSFRILLMDIGAVLAPLLVILVLFLIIELILT